MSKTITMDYDEYEELLKEIEKEKCLRKFIQVETIYNPDEDKFISHIRIDEFSAKLYLQSNKIEIEEIKDYKESE